MKATLAELLKVERLRKEAKAKLDELSTESARLAFRYRDHPNTFNRLIRLSDEANNATFSGDFSPQSERMGGPTEGPGSEHTRTYLRVPYGTEDRRHFPASEVAEAKGLGLLTGGDDLTGPV